MKVIAINGSPRFNGNTSMALKAMTDELERQGVETETIQIEIGRASCRERV